MKLIDPKTGFVVVEFNKTKTIFHNRFLHQEMKNHGIDIPSYLSKEYNNQTRVRLGDKLFRKAFKEVYYPSTMNSYIWEE